MAEITLFNQREFLAKQITDGREAAGFLANPAVQQVITDLTLEYYMRFNKAKSDEERHEAQSLSVALTEVYARLFSAATAGMITAERMAQRKAAETKGTE